MKSTIFLCPPAQRRICESSGVILHCTAFMLQISHCEKNPLPLPSSCRIAGLAWVTISYGPPPSQHLCFLWLILYLWSNYINYPSTAQHSLSCPPCYHSDSLGPFAWNAFRRIQLCVCSTSHSKRNPIGLNWIELLTSQPSLSILSHAWRDTYLPTLRNRRRGWGGSVGEIWGAWQTYLHRTAMSQPSGTYLHHAP